MVWYRGTSLIRNRHPTGPYSGTMPRVLGGSWGGRGGSYERGTPVGGVHPDLYCIATMKNITTSLCARSYLDGVWPHPIPCSGLNNKVSGRTQPRWGAGCGDKACPLNAIALRDLASVGASVMCASWSTRDTCYVIKRPSFAKCTQTHGAVPLARWNVPTVRTWGDACPYPRVSKTGNGVGLRLQHYCPGSDSEMHTAALPKCGSGPLQGVPRSSETAPPP